MADLGELGTFKMDSSKFNLAAISGAQGINQMLDTLGNRQQAQTFRMDPATHTLGVVTGKDAINAALDARSTGPEAQTFRMNPETETLGVAAGKDQVNTVLNQRGAELKKHVGWDMHRDAEGTRALSEMGHGGKAGGAEMAAAQSDPRVRAAAADLAKALKGHGSHASNVEAGRNKDKGHGIG